MAVVVVGTFVCSSDCAVARVGSKSDRYFFGILIFVAARCSEYIEFVWGKGWLVFGFGTEECPDSWDETSVLEDTLTGIANMACIHFESILSVVEAEESRTWVVWKHLEALCNYLSQHLVLRCHRNHTISCPTTIQQIRSNFAFPKEV